MIMYGNSELDRISFIRGILAQWIDFVFYLVLGSPFSYKIKFFSILISLLIDTFQVIFEGQKHDLVFIRKQSITGLILRE